MKNEENTDNPKIKIICRMRDNTCEEQLLVNGREAVSDAALHAQRLLRTFSPETLLRQLTQAYGKDSVLVFRTDARQMEEFSALLESHNV